MTTYAKPEAMPFLYRVRHAKRNFIVQQGFSPSCSTTCDLQYSALLFMPRLLGLAFLAAAVLRLPTMFFALGMLLWWCVGAPRFNPLNWLYNWVMAPVSGVTLTPAPAPRRFSQFLGGSFALAIAASQATGAYTTALVLQAILLAAVSAVVFGGFCLGSFLFHILRGHRDVAMRTLPWAGDAWLRTLAERRHGDVIKTQSTVEQAENVEGTVTCEWQVQAAGCLS